MDLMADGNPGVKIKARFMRESASGEMELYSCEDDDVWFPKREVSYNDAEGTLLVARRVYEQKVAQGEL